MVGVPFSPLLAAHARRESQLERLARAMGGAADSFTQAAALREKQRQDDIAEKRQGLLDQQNTAEHRMRLAEGEARIAGLRAKAAPPVEDGGPSVQQPRSTGPTPPPPAPTGPPAAPAAVDPKDRQNAYKTAQQKIAHAVTTARNEGGDANTMLLRAIALIEDDADVQAGGVTHADVSAEIERQMAEEAGARVASKPANPGRADRKALKEAQDAVAPKAAAAATKALKEVQDAEKSLAQIDRIIEGAGRFNIGPIMTPISDFTAKIQPEWMPGGQGLVDYQTWRSDVQDAFNAILRADSGASVTTQEAARALLAELNAGLDDRAFAAKAKLVRSLYEKDVAGAKQRLDLVVPAPSLILPPKAPAPSGSTVVPRGAPPSADDFVGR